MVFLISLQMLDWVFESINISNREGERRADTAVDEEKKGEREASGCVSDAK